MVENCPINIKGRNLPINLSVFKSLGYDVIQGMDWLSKYYASINCREKVVVFQLPGVERFKFNGCKLLHRYFPQYKLQGVYDKEH
jgi:hypothetical protein